MNKNALFFGSIFKGGFTNRCCDNDFLNIAVQDTDTVDLNGNGTVGNPITANVIVSEEEDNILVVNEDGLYVPPGGGGESEGSNGLSTALSGDIVFGQDVGEVGDPAAITSNRQIPLGVFEIQFTTADSSVEILAGRINIESDSAVSSPTLVITDTDTSANITLYISSSEAIIESNTDVQISGTTIQMNNPVGIGIAPTAWLTLPPGQSSSLVALKFDPTGVAASVPEQGAMEYDGSQLTFTRIAVQEVVLMTDPATVTAEALVSDTTIVITIGGNSFKLLAVAI